ncbi:CpaE family protein [Planctomyces sp. SH-PL62]|uniref:AAA family ATPase n=1 Tax=Planctomyces sp. SH-PL62 TaxID=1636152 RepID=UPI00078E0246|nr:hypothetical protein [Planctomyces sp. SH-PL62]AMV38178.1 CobQ/CobB/MinD/ParA nucleotide binding domain protein [Planctomyces sp. SH-PL62]
MPCFIVADDESIASRIRSVLAFHKRDCPKTNVLPTDQAAGRLGREPAVGLVVAVLPPDPATALELLARLAPMADGGLLAVGPTSDARLVVQALRTGVRDYLDRSDLEAELDAAVKRMAASTHAGASHGRVVAVLAPSGGSGSSTIAANLASAMAAEHGSAGLFDLKLEAGDLAALLDLKPTYTLADLCKTAAPFDKVMLERSFARHESGVSLLAAPRRLADAPLVRPEGVARALDLARSLFPAVVVDVDHHFRDEQLVAIRDADVLAVVFRLDFNSLRNVHRTMEHLGRLGLAGDRVRLVVNRSGQPGEVPHAKAEEALGGVIAFSVPEDARTVARANNNGVPFVIEAPSSKVARSLVQLARLLVPPSAHAGASASAESRPGWRPWRKRNVAAL